MNFTQYYNMMINKMASVNLVHLNNNYKFMQVIKPTIQRGPILLSQQNVHNHGCKILPLRCSSTSSPTIERHSFNYQPSIWNLEFLKSLEKNHIKAQVYFSFDFMFLWHFLGDKNYSITSGSLQRDRFSERCLSGSIH